MTLTGTLSTDLGQAGLMEVPKAGRHTGLAGWLMTLAQEAEQRAPLYTSMGISRMRSAMGACSLRAHIWMWVSGYLRCSPLEFTFTLILPPA